MAKSLKAAIRAAYKASPQAKVDALRDEIRKWERRYTIASTKLEDLYAIQGTLLQEFTETLMAQHGLCTACEEKTEP